MTNSGLDASRPGLEAGTSGLDAVVAVDARQAQVLGRSIAQMLHALEGTKLADSKRVLCAAGPTTFVGTATYSELYVGGELGAFLRFGVDASRVVDDKVMRVHVGSDLADTDPAVQHDVAFAVASRLAAAHRALGSHGLTLRADGAATLNGLPAALLTFGFNGDDRELRADGVVDLLNQQKGQPLDLTDALRTLGLAGGATSVERHAGERQVDLVEALRRLPHR